MDDLGSRVRFPAGAGNFSLHHRVQTGSGSHPASYPMGTGAVSLGIKRPGRKVDHSPPSSAEVKNAWSYTSTLQYVFMTWCLIKNRDNFTFIFYAPTLLELKLCSPKEIKSRDGSVGIALSYGLDDQGSRFRFPAGAGNFSLHHRFQNGSGAHPPSYPMGTEGSFPGVKAARGVKLITHLHLVPRSKNEWSYTFTPPIRLHGVVLS
jgi:hypothetical protein